MIKLLLLLLVFPVTVWAFIPPVESLFRHGSNPDVPTNGLIINMVVKKLQPGNVSGSVQDVSLLKEEKLEDFYKIYFTKISNDSLKVAQTRYGASNFADTSLEHKVYYPHFTPYTIKPSIEQMERGLFFGLLNSLAFNNGSHLVNYLKSLGVPVKLNHDIINREKVEILANYKHYLVAINKNKASKSTLANPIRPEDVEAKNRIETILASSMYVDNGQVKLSREDGQMAWLISAGPFEAVVSYKERDVQKIKFKSLAGEFEIQCKDYWLANGTHRMPRYMMVKNFSGETYQVEVTNLRHFMEREDDLVKRQKSWDQILKGRESTDLRPEFLL